MLDCLQFVRKLYKVFIQSKERHRSIHPDFKRNKINVEQGYNSCFFCCVKNYPSIFTYIVEDMKDKELCKDVLRTMPQQFGYWMMYCLFNKTKQFKIRRQTKFNRRGYDYAWNS